jgi:hypothetical protein
VLSNEKTWVFEIKRGAIFYKMEITFCLGRKQGVKKKKKKKKKKKYKKKEREL